MPETPILAIDAGTSTLKACLYDQGGQLAAAASRPYGYRTPRPGWAEADPAEWWAALTAALGDLQAAGHDLGQVQVLGLTGQMHTAVLLDRDGAVMPPTILWLDRRATAEAGELAAQYGLPPQHLNSSYTLPKLVWLARRQPEVLARIETILWPKDYLRYRLTGERATDATEAGGAALLNWASGQWAVERLAPTGLDGRVLPPIRPAESLAAPLLRDVARDLGLPVRTRVIIGAGDVIALLGGAPPDPGLLSYSLGSSSMVSVLLAPGQPAPEDPAHRVYVYRLGEYRLLNAVSSTTGACWQWAVQTLLAEADPAQAMGQAMALAESAPPGAGGLVFLPYLAGERSPFWSDTLRGAFLGLGLGHDRAHLLRAVLEGVGLSLRLLLGVYAELGVRPDEIALAGGGARAPLWPRVLADTCQLPVAIYAAEETVTRPLYGWCAMQLEPGLGFLDALRRTFDTPRRVTPRTDLAALYGRAYELYRNAADFMHHELERNPL